MKPSFFRVLPLAAFCLSAIASIQAQTQRIYTSPDPAASGGIEGKLTADEIVRAMAVDHERGRVYLGALADGGRTFRFSNLPVGKYDLALLTKSHAILEGATLGDTAEITLPAASQKNLRARIETSEKFFNRIIVHRVGIDGERALAFIERIRDNPTLQQSGEKLEANLRRFEIVELNQATDDWQMAATRILYREQEPLGGRLNFSRHAYVPALGNVRVVDKVKTLAPISPPNP